MRDGDNPPWMVNGGLVELPFSLRKYTIWNMKISIYKVHVSVRSIRTLRWLAHRGSLCVRSWDEDR